MMPKITYSDIQFLAGGGDMGQLIREKDWSKNPLGPPETWPQSLRTTLGILLNSKFPMFLWWGDDLICFYNDAYRPSLGKEGKHPSILGMKAIDAWPEIWEIIKPMIDSVITTGEATWNEDTLIPIYRNNKMEDVYWTFSYSPVCDENSNIAGVLVNCFETTDRVDAKKKIQRNEERLNIVLEASELGIWELDLKTKKVSYSKRYLEIIGGYKDYIELTHEQLKKHIHPDDMEIRDKALKEALATGILNYQARLIWNDKSIHWMEGIGRVFYDEENQPVKLMGTIRDITSQKMFIHEMEQQVNERTKELKQLNEDLKQSEERYHLMVEEVQDYAILYLNKEGIVENWNKGAEKIKGYKAEEIVGKSFSNFYTDEDRKSNLPQYLLSQAAKYGRYGQEGWRVRKDGSLFWASVVITAVHNGSGEIIGYSKVTHDLTFKKEADDKIRLNSEILAQKNRELEKMNKELQSFAYISSHDLQEPLRKIQTFANQIAEREAENLSEDGKDKFKRMQNAAKRMQTLINDLLAYSRTNTHEIKLKKTNLNDIVEEVKEDLKEELQLKNGRIEIGKLGEAEIIPFQFHQLMFNLASNSLKFSRENVPPKITIKGEIIKGEDVNNDRLLPKVKYCHITFSDNGIGFEQQYSDKIFEVFQRLHGKEVYPGTGIGLAIVKKIMDNHNGVITASGTFGQGAIFDIYIPLNGTK